jgi:NadR type nicotinamide-nucleotide adenylyltransferase
MEAQSRPPAVARVVLTGSESTGKTALAARLAGHYRTVASREFVREYLLSSGGALDFDDHGPIARGQMAAEDEAAARATGLVLLDTDLMSTVVYCEHYFGRCPEWIVDAARERAGDLYLLMNTDVPWIPDPARDRGDRREQMHGLFRAKLESLALPWVEISGDWTARFAAAVRAVDGVMSRWAGRPDRG